MSEFEFVKMNGLGNDFVIIDQRNKITKLSSNTPKNIIEITVATRGPDPLAIGYTLVKSPI